MNKDKGKIDEGPTLPPASTGGTIKTKKENTEENGTQSLDGTRTTRPKRVTPVAAAEA